MTTENAILKYAADLPKLCRYLNRKRISGKGADKVLDLVNKAIDGYGIEAITSHKIWEPYWCNIVATYINMGDTYVQTLVFDTVINKWSAVCFGDWIEKYQQKYGIE